MTSIEEAAFPKLPPKTRRCMEVVKIVSVAGCENNQGPRRYLKERPTRLLPQPRRRQLAATLGNHLACSNTILEILLEC